MAVKKWEPSTYEKSDELKALETQKSNLLTSKPSEFSYADYTESDTVKQAREALNSLQKPGAYQSQWQNSLNDTLNKILNREKFTYDLNGDMLYQQYKDQYVNQGKMAMMDTMGQAQAATGGYGNSYAQSVGQQAYQGYLQQLNDKVPELYQLALDQYNREGDDLYNQYGLLADRENTDYGRYRDTVSDYNTERDFLTNQYNNERQWDYGQYSDAYDRAFNENRANRSDWESDLDRVTNDALNLYQQEYGQFSDQQQMGYNLWRNAVEDDQWQQNYNQNQAQIDYNKALEEAEIAASLGDYSKYEKLGYNVDNVTDPVKYRQLSDSQISELLMMADDGSEEGKEQMQKRIDYYKALGYDPDILYSLFETVYPDDLIINDTLVKADGGTHVSESGRIHGGASGTFGSETYDPDKRQKLLGSMYTK